MHQDDAYAKIDRFFDEMKEEIEARKFALKDEISKL